MPSPQIKKHAVSIDDPIASLLEIALAISTNLVQLPWDDTVFGRNNDIALYIYMMDVLEFEIENRSLIYPSLCFL